MQKSTLHIALIFISLSISCSDPLSGASPTNQNVQSTPLTTSGMPRNRGWRKVEAPLDQSADVVVLGQEGQIAIAGPGILLLSLDHGQSWRSITQGKGSNLYTANGKDFQNGSDDQTISIAKLCSIEMAVFSQSGRLYLNTTCDHSSALWSLPIKSLSDAWYVRGFAPTAEEFDQDREYSSPGRNLVAANGRIIVDGRISKETVLLTTDDDGATWLPIWRDRRATRVVGLDFLDGLNGWMLQADGRLFRTENGGSKWIVTSTLPSTAVGRVTSIDFVNRTTAFVVGEDGLILTTKDGGQSWQQRGSDIKASLSRVAALDENKAWIVGERGTLLETDDGGMTWQKHSLGIDEDIQTITVKNGVAWFVAGRHVYRSN